MEGIFFCRVPPPLLFFTTIEALDPFNTVAVKDDPQFFKYITVALFLPEAEDNIQVVHFLGRHDPGTMRLGVEYTHFFHRFVHVSQKISHIETDNIGYCSYTHVDLFKFLGQ